MTETLLEPVSQAINQYIGEGEFSSYQGPRDFRFRRLLGEKMPVVAFRPFGALPILVREFSGDVTMAVAYAYSPEDRKPLVKGVYLSNAARQFGYDAYGPHIVNAFLNPGENACQVLGDYDSSLMLALIERVGIDGKLFHLVPENLTSPSLLPLPKQIRSRSVNMVVETGAFTVFPEEDKEELLWEMDRVLKPGGMMVLREFPDAQEAVKYYGAGLLNSEYTRYSVRGLQKNHWLMFKKPEEQALAITPHTNGTEHTIKSTRRREQWIDAEDLLRIASAQEDKNLPLLRPSDIA